MIQQIHGGITAPEGFWASGEHVGIRRKRKDLALVKSEVACEYAGMFTVSTAKAAPVVWNKTLLDAGKKIKAVVVNSGNANSCTGPVGLTHAEAMAEKTAQCLGCERDEVIVASTGVIGMPLPIETIKKGISFTSKTLSRDYFAATGAAEAIMTTDLYLKQTAVQFEIEGTQVTLGAMAKGSGMLHPNMATMLSFLTTDLNITAEMLGKALKESVDKTYNMLSVDADTSTNDMVALLANGMANNPVIDCNNESYYKFVEALNKVNELLTKEIAKDGEGASKLFEVEVSGGCDLAEVRTLARAVVSSNLVKTALFANDPNWGRIVAAMGSTEIEFDPNKLDITISSNGNFKSLVSNGMPCLIDESIANSILSAQKVYMKVDLNLGSHSAKAWGCDLTHDYISLSSKYRSSQIKNFEMKNEGAA